MRGLLLDCEACRKGMKSDTNFCVRVWPHYLAQFEVVEVVSIFACRTMPSRTSPFHCSLPYSSINSTMISVVSRVPIVCFSLMCWLRYAACAMDVPSVLYRREVHRACQLLCYDVPDKYAVICFIQHIHLAC